MGLAARLGGGRRTVQDWEAGVNDPGAERLEALTDVLIEIFRARATSSVRCKADALLDLEGLSHPRVVPFLLDVLASDTNRSTFSSLRLRRSSERDRRRSLA